MPFANENVLVPTLCVGTAFLPLCGALDVDCRK